MAVVATGSEADDDESTNCTSSCGKMSGCVDDNHVMAKKCSDMHHL